MEQQVGAVQVEDAWEPVWCEAEAQLDAWQQAAAEFATAVVYTPQWVSDEDGLSRREEWEDRQAGAVEAQDPGQVDDVR